MMYEYIGMEQAGVTATLQTYVRDIAGSNFGRYTDILT